MLRPPHLRLRQPGALAEALPGRALAVGGIDAVDQELKAQRLLALVPQRQRGRQGEVGPGGIPANGDAARVNPERGALACREPGHRQHLFKCDRELHLGRQLVIDRQGGDSALPNQVAQEMVPAIQAALHKSAAVGVDQQRRALNAVRKV